MMKNLTIAFLSLLSVAAPAGEPAHCRIVKHGSLPIEFTRFRPMLHGKFNGVDLQLLLDSGAFTTTLTPTGVKKAGLDERHSDLVSVGVGGKSQTYIAVADEVEIGPARGRSVHFLEAVELNIHSDGVLGADYLFRTDLELNFRDNQVIFIRTEGDCEDAPIAYWDRGTDWVESRDMPKPEDRRQRIEVRINGRPFTALLDTGATQSVLDLEAAARIGLAPDSVGTTPAGESSGLGAEKMRIWRAPIDSFEIGSESIRKTQIEIGDLNGPGRKALRSLGGGEPDMLLGADFMRAHRLLFARSQHRLYFTYLGGPVFALEPSPEEMAADAARYRQAAERNSAPDMLGFAQMLALGRGVEKDPVESYKWLRIAGETPWAKTHPDFEAAVLRESASLLEELDERQAEEARKRAKAWTLP